MARDTSLSGESGRGQPYHLRPEAREKQAHCSCARRAEGYMCRFDEVMCCEVMEWQRTSLARNRNADRVGIHCFIKEKISLTDRKSTRLNSSHGYISYAVFCLKKKKKNNNDYIDVRYLH